LLRNNWKTDFTSQRARRCELIHAADAESVNHIPGELFASQKCSDLATKAWDESFRASAYNSIDGWLRILLHRCSYQTFDRESEFMEN
jgi:hypothetical protein